MKTYRLTDTEMAAFGTKVVAAAKQSDFQTVFDKGIERSKGSMVSHSMGVRVQQCPRHRLMQTDGSTAPTYDFLFRVERQGGEIKVRWEHAEITVYHCEGKTGGIAGKFSDELKEFLLSSILAELKHPVRVRQAEAA